MMVITCLSCKKPIGLKVEMVDIDMVDYRGVKYTESYELMLTECCESNNWASVEEHKYSKEVKK
jgi:hypothetical protein|tara:strand:- start:1718 stop:1909 length:192 start_codon:yes stop_codon:yes gene_type:complete